MAPDTELRLRRIASELGGRSPTGSELRQHYGLDSLDLVHFVSHIEEDFAVEIPDAELIAANFVTIESVAALLIRLGAAAPPT